MVDQEAWEKYLRVAGTGDKSEPGEEKKVQPPKERRTDDRDKPGQRNREGDDGGNSGEGTGEPSKKGKGTTTLKYGPVCCSCSKNGVHDIAHTVPISTPTFITRPIRPNSGTGIGLCLMPNSRGTMRLNEGPVCGHTPCPNCTVVKQERTMCKCCADRIEAHGPGVGGAGPLPPLQVAEEEERKVSRSNSHDSRAGPSRSKRRKDRSVSRSQGHGRRAPKSPSPEPVEGKRRRQEAWREGRTNPLRGKNGGKEDDGDYEWVAEELPEERGCRNCGRDTRGGFAVCCEACYKTGGRAHTKACDDWNKRTARPPPDYRRDGPEGDDDEDSGSDGEGGTKGKRKGKKKGRGKGKGKVVILYKTYNKWVRDKERWKNWARPGKQRARVTNGIALKKAPQVGRARPTTKNDELGIRMWDSTLEELKHRGLVAQRRKGFQLTPASSKAGLAPSELYLLPAINRHGETGGLLAARGGMRSSTDQEGLNSPDSPAMWDRTCWEKEARLHCPAHFLLVLVRARMGKAEDAWISPKEADLCVDRKDNPLTHQLVSRAVKGVAVQEAETLQKDGQEKDGARNPRTTSAILAGFRRT